MCLPTVQVISTKNRSIQTWIDQENRASFFQLSPPLPPPPPPPPPPSSSSCGTSSLACSGGVVHLRWVQVRWLEHLLWPRSLWWLEEVTWLPQAECSSFFCFLRLSFFQFGFLFLLFGYLWAVDHFLSFLPFYCSRCVSLCVSVCLFAVSIAFFRYYSVVSARGQSLDAPPTPQWPPMAANGR